MRRGRALTPWEMGLILGIVALLVLCCCGWGLVSAFTPSPAPMAPYPVATPSY